MPAHSIATTYFSGQGNVMIADRDVSGNPLGFKLMGNISALALGSENQTFEHKESTTGQRAIDLRLVQELNVTLSMTVEKIKAENLSFGFFGNKTVVAAGSVSTLVKIAYVAVGGEQTFIMELDHINISTVVVQDSADTITFLVDENFLINEDSGSLEILDATAQGTATNPITDLDELHIDYAYDAQVVFEALTTAAPEKWMRFEGLNTASSNDNHVIDVYKFRPDPASEWALINEEIAQFEISGSALLDATKPTSGSQFFRQRAVR